MPRFEHRAFAQNKVEIHEPELVAMVMRGDYLSRRARLLRRWRWALAAALALLVAVAGLLLAVGPGQRAAAQDLPLRLHIIANSDNAADQALKLQVRDAVVEYLTPLLAQVQTREEAEALLAEQLPQLQALAAGMTADFGYGAQAEMGRFDFPARRYGQLQLPAGEYPALRLVLGEGAGRNWWCVLFPPLCFVDEAGEFAVCPEAGGAAPEGSLLAGERQVKLKICEIFNQK